jgi:hypothetical protein
MGWLGLKRKPPPVEEPEPEEVIEEPSGPLLTVLVPDVAGVSSFRLNQFHSTEEAAAFLKSLPPGTLRGVHAFWALHYQPPIRNDEEASGEALVLIRAAHDPGMVYVVSFVDIDSAQSFARFEVKRGMEPGLLMIYWAELVTIEPLGDGYGLTPEAPPPIAQGPDALPEGPASHREASQVLVVQPVARTREEPEPGPPPNRPGPAVQPQEHPAPTATEAHPVAAAAAPDSAASETEPAVAAESHPQIPVDPAEPSLAETPAAEPPAGTEEQAPDAGPAEADKEQHDREAPEPAVEVSPEPAAPPAGGRERPPPAVAQEPGAPAAEGHEKESEAGQKPGREMPVRLEIAEEAQSGQEEPETEDEESGPEAADNAAQDAGAGIGPAEPPQGDTEGAEAAPAQRGEDPDADGAGERTGELEMDVVEEVEKLLQRRRWERKDSPFKGFDSPPGRF